MPADFWLFDEKRNREHPVVAGLRGRVLRELLARRGMATVGEVLGAAPSVRVVGEEAMLGKTMVRVVPEASPALSLSQSYNSHGHVTLAGSCAFNNALRRLDTLNFELKHQYGEGTSYEARWLLPFSALPGHSFALAARRGHETLCDGLRLRQHGASLALRSRGREEGELGLELARRRLEFDPLAFADRETRFARHSLTALTLRYGRLLWGGAPARNSGRLTTEAILFRERPPDFRAQLACEWSVPYLAARWLSVCSLQHFATLSLHCTLPGGPGLSPLHASAFPALRGFSNVEANVRFPGAGMPSRLPPWQLSASHSSQLQFDDFGLFGQGLLLPFAHLTQYASLSRGERPLRLHAAVGVGMGLRLQPGARAEVLFNFAHFNLAASRFNRQETFQLRLSTGD